MITMADKTPLENLKDILSKADAVAESESHSVELKEIQQVNISQNKASGESVPLPQLANSENIKKQ